MGFDNPIPRPDQRLRREPGISARVTTFGRHKTTVRVQLRFTRALADILEDRCDILLGDGPDEGAVMLQFHDRGTHTIIRINKDERTLLRFAPPPYVPEYLFSSVECRWEWRDKTHMVVWLPIQEWKESIIE